MAVSAVERMGEPLRNQPTPAERQLLEELLREINGGEP